MCRNTEKEIGKKEKKEKKKMMMMKKGNLETIQTPVLIFLEGLLVIVLSL